MSDADKDKDGAVDIRIDADTFDAVRAWGKRLLYGGGAVALLGGNVTGHVPGVREMLYGPTIPVEIREDENTGDAIANIAKHYATIIEEKTERIEELERELELMLSECIN